MLRHSQLYPITSDVGCAGQNHQSFTHAEHGNSGGCVDLAQARSAPVTLSMPTMVGVRDALDNPGPQAVR